MVGERRVGKDRLTETAPIAGTDGFLHLQFSECGKEWVKGKRQEKSGLVPKWEIVRSAAVLGFGFDSLKYSEYHLLRHFSQLTLPYS